MQHVLSERKYLNSKLKWKETVYVYLCIYGDPFCKRGGYRLRHFANKFRVRVLLKIHREVNKLS